MKNKGKMRRLKMAAWAAFMLPLLALNTNLANGGASSDADRAAYHEELCAAGPSTFYYGYDAYAADYYEQPYFVGDYFRNLTEHFPTNNCGNCGYTSAAMLLCYYDTYWNGNIIDDSFNSDPAKITDPKSSDYSSPGIKDFAADIDEIKRERPKDGAPQWEWDDYNAYLVDEIYGPYLHKMDEPYLRKTNLISYLYYLARRKNQNNQALWNFGIKEPTTEATMTLVKNLLNLYFDEMGLTGLIEAKMVHYTTVTLPQTHPSEPMQRMAVRKAAIGKLLKGQPIIYRGDIATDSGYYDKSQNYVGSGHAAIAYGFDAKAKSIIGHIGWKGKEEYSRMNFDEVFGDFDGFIYLEVDPDLEFTYPNERFDAGQYLSACDLCSHIHADDEHRAKVCYGDPEYHALQCICGETTYEMHDHEEMVPFDEQNHALKCECGDVTYEEHTLSVEHHNSLYHSYKCACGYEKLERHHFRLGGMMKYVCSDCGFSMPAGVMPGLI